MKEEKTGSISEIIFHNDENYYTIAVFETEDEQFVAVGSLAMPRKGRSYRLTGEWTTHPRYGEQFAFSSSEELEPSSEEGIAAFLCSGVIKGIGPMAAARIVRRFGTDTLRIIREEPGRLTEISGIGDVKAKAISAGYQEHREYADTVMKLAAFDISAAVCMKLYKAYGTQAVDVVRENPYQLIDDLYGIGFQKADKIARNLGFSSDSPFRIRSGIMHLMEQRGQNGDTYAVKRDFIEESAGFLDVSREQADEACFDLIMDGKLFSEVLSGTEILMLWRYHRAEQRVAAALFSLAHSELVHIAGDTDRLIAATEKESGIELSDRQKLAVVSSLKNGVSVITGGPGTGKTTIINAILNILSPAGIKTTLAAPTGRAAKRMSQTTGREALTIHRLLEYSFSEGEDYMRFGKNEENRLDFGCIIIDEMSMVDIMLMDALLAAVRPGTRLILVGDADQLPPVGAGNVLRDILDSDTVHSVRLTEIFRQARESLIVVNAHLIDHGEYPSYNEKDKDFFMLERESEKDIAETIRDLCLRRLPAYYTDVDPFSDIQVLTPTRRGRLGCTELNAMLQDVLNPVSPEKNERRFGDTVFREGDKVMQNKNDYLIEWKDLRDFSTGSGVFNGDIGIVQTVDNDAGTVSVLFDGERLVSYDLALLEELEPAYALTVHKSQGSEFPIVVMPIARFPQLLSSRNLLYTAVTRARQAVVLVGYPQMVNAMVDNDFVSKRCSGLSERLQKLWREFSD